MSIDKTYSFNELVEYLCDDIKNGLVPMLWGPPGIGKSEIGKAVAAKLGYMFKYLNAAILQPFDYAAAVPDMEKKIVELYKTGFIPSEGNWIIIVEDIPFAKIYQQTPLMQMMLNHSIGPCTFPESVRFIASGNRDSDYCYTNPISSALKNRMTHWYMGSNVESWANLYARSNGLDERIIAFNLAFQQYHHENPKLDVNAFPTPRSWEFASKSVSGYDHTKEDQLRKIRAKVASCVGEAAAGAFYTWLQYLRNIDPAKVLEEGEISNESKKARDQVYAIIYSVACYVKKMDKKKIDIISPKIMKFFSNLSNDFKSTFLTELLIINAKGVKDASIVMNILQNPEAAKYMKETEFLKQICYGSLN